MGFIQRSPLHRQKQPASTPGLAEANPSAGRRQSTCMFRPCRSTRLRRFTPLAALQAYCILQSIMGFATFQTSARKLPSSSVAQTLRSFSLSDRQTALPRSFPSRRCLRHLLRVATFLAPEPRPQGFKPVEKSVASNWCFHLPLLVASMGLWT